MEKLDGIEKRKVMEMMKTNQTGAITLDWMYREDKPDSEEYLLGKQVDKHVEGETITMEDEFDAKFGERIKANIALDMQTKMREDPLFIIKQKEIEARKKIVDNPVKMKQLESMIAKQKKIQEKKDKKKKKKKKKHKKKRGSSDSDSDDDNKLVAQYLSILSKKNQNMDSSEHQKGKHSNIKDRKRGEKARERSTSGGKEIELGERKRHRQDNSFENGDQDRKRSGYSARARDSPNRSYNSNWADDRSRKFSGERGKDRKICESEVLERDRQPSSDYKSRRRESFSNHRTFKRSEKERERSDSDSDHNDKRKNKKFDDTKDRWRNEEPSDQKRDRSNNNQRRRNETENKGRSSERQKEHQSPNDRLKERRRNGRRGEGRNRSSSDESNKDLKNKHHRKHVSSPQRERMKRSKPSFRDEQVFTSRKKPESSSSSSSSSDASEDDGRRNKQRTDSSSSEEVKHRKHNKLSLAELKKTKHRSSSEQADGRPAIDDRMTEKKGKEKEKQRSPDARRHSGDENRKHKQYGLILSANSSQQKSQRESSSPVRKKHRSRSKSSENRKYKRSKSPQLNRRKSKSPKRKSPKRHITEEERDRKLAEMMENAKWRDNQRKKNVKRYDEETKKEEDELMKGHKCNFLNSMMSDHASQSTIEDRLKRNKYNIQRTRNALDKNFTKK